MKARHFFSLVALVIGVILDMFVIINQGAINARAVIERTGGHPATSSSDYLLAITLATVAIIAIFQFATRRGHLFFALPLIGVLLLGACSGGQKFATTDPKEVTYVVPIGSDNTVQGDVHQSEFWVANRKLNIQSIAIPHDSRRTGAGLFGTEIGASRTDYDSLMVVVVDKSPVQIDWIAPAILRNADGSCSVPDMSSAFAMQSLESNGGSTGVYTGATLTATITDDDAALYVATYGYGAMDESRNVHHARDLKDVLSTLARSYIQQQLSEQYGTRSVVEQNRDMSQIFSAIAANLTAQMKKTGITINSLYDRDGNIYENCTIQHGFDDSLSRQQDLERMMATSTAKAIEATQEVQFAYAQATATTVAAQSAANAQMLMAQSAPSACVLFYQHWDGKMSTVYNGQSPFPVCDNPTPVPSN